MKSWFAVYAAYRCEFAAERRLIELGFEAYCPRERVVVRRRGRSHKQTQPLLPRYLFVGLTRDVHGDFPYPAVTGLEEVDGIVGVKGAPLEVAFDRPDPETLRERKRKCAPLPDYVAPTPMLVIRELMEAEAAGDFDKTARTRKEPEKGDQIRITGGKFRGFPATFMQMRGEERVEVLFTIFGRDSPLLLKTAEVDWGAEAA